MKPENKRTLIYDLISAAAIVIYTVSYIINIGWIRIIGLTVEPVLCGMVFVGCHLASRCSDVLRTRKFAVLSYSAFIIRQLVLSDFDDNTSYMFFRVFKKTPFWLNAATAVTAALLLALSIVVFVNQIIMYAKYKKGFTQAVAV